MFARSEPFSVIAYSWLEHTHRSFMDVQTMWKLLIIYDRLWGLIQLLVWFQEIVTKSVINNVEELKAAPHPTELLEDLRQLSSEVRESASSLRCNVCSKEISFSRHPVDNIGGHVSAHANENSYCCLSCGGIFRSRKHFAPNKCGFQSCKDIRGLHEDHFRDTLRKCFGTYMQREAKTDVSHSW